jgi:UDP-2,4-diacetamido-2,4,6-trideoxy-beta-L-altropyranose hydrolase
MPEPAPWRRVADLPDDKRVLLVRADADSKIGAGHVMRTLALAEAWQCEGGQAVFAAAGLPSAVERRLSTEGIETVPLLVRRGTPEDARAVAELAQTRDAHWVIVDGYHFDADYQRILKGAGLGVLVMDDGGHLSHYCADFVLSQNPQADPTMYHSCEAETELLLGTRFTLLRREFWKWRRWQRSVPDVAARVLVTFGGGDSGGAAEKVLRAVRGIEVDDLECVVAAGAMSPELAMLEEIARAPGRHIEIRHKVPDMAELMAWADVAVAAAGSTSLELAFMGLPALLVTIADNQEPLAKCLAALGSASDLGRAELLDEAKLAEELQALAKSRTAREAMASAGRNLVDGYGASRVVQRLLGEKVRLRDATSADAELLWRWANEPETRANSFSGQAISWSDHVDWLSQRLNSPTSRLLVAVDKNDVPIGQARLDVDGQGAILSISVDRGFRHQGLGSATIPLVLKEATRSFGVAWVDALIKPENEASLRAFSSSGFVNTDRAMTGANVGYLRYRWHSNCPRPDSQGVKR